MASESKTSPAALVIVGIFLCAFGGIIFYYLAQYVYYQRAVAGEDGASRAHEAARLLVQRRPEAALALLEDLLTDVSKEDDPQLFGYVKRLQGDCYRWLGRRSEQETNLSKAVEAYREALDVYPVEEFPVAHASLLVLLGSTYRDLGQVSNPDRNLAEALRNYQEALKVYSVDDYPIEYAKIQNHLGTTYLALAGHRDKQQNLRKAVQAYQEALKALSEKAVSEEDVKPLIRKVEINLQGAQRLLQ